MSCIPRFVLLVALLFAFDVQAQGLFVDLPMGRSSVDAIAPDPIPASIKRSRLVGLDLSILTPHLPAARSAGLQSGAAISLPPILLNLFPDLPPVQLQITAEEVLVDGSVVWRGQPAGLTGLVTLVVNGIQVTGQVQVGDRMIEIRPARFGLHRIIEIDQNAFPREGDAHVPPASSSAAAPRQLQVPRGPAAPADSSSTTINVLVVYGERSAAASPNIQGEIQLAVSTANTIYGNSGIPIALNLVGTQKMTGYDEGSRSYENVLSDLTGTSDGRLDSVHSLRASVQADLVVYLTERTEYCGLAWLYDGTPNYGFAVVTRSCASSNYTLAHELGHNMGANHDRYVEGGGSSGAYNYGFTDPSAPVPVRTVMAYNDACAAVGVTCTRIPYFSSPYLTYNGRPLGVNPWSTSAAYNVRKLTETRTAIAAFRSGTVATAAPANGWWWNTSEGGRGYSIEIVNGVLFFAVYSYAADGSAVWYISTGPMTDAANYTGTLQQYSGGQTLGGSFRTATNLGSIGTLQLHFYSETEGYVVFPTGSWSYITRFDFITNGSVGGPAPGSPQTGWWWNAAEPGRGYFIEAQNTSMFVSFYMYNGSGQAVWYVASGAMISSTLFQGTLQEYSGGSPLSGTFRSPNSSAGVGTVTIQFPTTGTATMTLPTGTQVPLTRFTF